MRCRAWSRAREGARPVSSRDPRRGSANACRCPAYETRVPHTAKPAKVRDDRTQRDLWGRARQCQLVDCRKAQQMLWESSGNRSFGAGPLRFLPRGWLPKFPIRNESTRRAWGWLAEIPQVTGFQFGRAASPPVAGASFNWELAAGSLESSVTVSAASWVSVPASI